MLSGCFAGRTAVPDSITALNERFGLGHELAFADGPGGLTLANIATRHGSAAVSLSGGQVMQWSPAGQRPVLWLSPEARFAPGKTIRGGAPICWPWFGPHENNASFPAHGFARTSPWTVDKSTGSPDGSIQLTLLMAPDNASRDQWPHAATAKVVISLGSELRIDLITRNGGGSPIVIGEALHTYFAVSDVRRTAISGLAGCLYFDKSDGGRRKVQDGDIIIGDEVDRLYVNTTSECTITDSGFARRIRIRKSGSRSTVVWNPWADKAAKLGGFGHQGHLGMVCVESGNAGENVVVVDAGGEHVLSARYSIERLA
jgi:glucose-6-phosphate 1-epimerase